MKYYQLLIVATSLTFSVNANLSSSPSPPPPSPPFPSPPPPSPPFPSPPPPSPPLPSQPPSTPSPMAPPPAYPPNFPPEESYVHALDVLIPVAFAIGLCLTLYCFCNKKPETVTPAVNGIQVEQPTVYNTVPPIGMGPSAGNSSFNNGINQPVTPRTSLTQSTNTIVNLSDVSTLPYSEQRENPFMSRV